MLALPVPDMVPLFVKSPLMAARIVSPKLKVPPALTVTFLKLAMLPLPHPIFSTPLMIVLFATETGAHDMSQAQLGPTDRSWPTITPPSPACPPLEPLIVKSLRTVNEEVTYGAP